MRPVMNVKNDPDADPSARLRVTLSSSKGDSGDPATVRHTAAPDAGGENTDTDPQGERESPMPEEEGYGYGV